jgi:hypothetical protein
MINFVSVCEGCIELFDTEGKWVATYRSPGMIAEVIRENGGLAPVVYKSSDWDEAECFGFDSVAEADRIWERAVAFFDSEELV